MKTSGITAALILAWSATLQAAALTTTNGDFSLPNIANDSQHGNIAPANWYKSTTSFTAWANRDVWYAGTPSQHLALGKIGDALGWAYQSLGLYDPSFGTTLHYTFDQNRFADDGNGSARMNLDFYKGSFAGAASGTDIIGNATLFYQDAVAQSYNEWDAVIGNNGIRTITGTVDLSSLAAGTEVWVRIGVREPGGNNFSGFGPVDNLFVTQVPEPGTAALVSVGVACLCGRRRRRA